MAVPRRTILLSAAGAFAARAVPPPDQVTPGAIGSGGRGTFLQQGRRIRWNRDKAV